MKKGKTISEKMGFDENISRKTAIKKAGITALAATSLFFLETKAHASASSNNNGNHYGQDK